MKSLLQILLFSYSIFLNAQTIPNSGFENWETLGSGMNSYQEPSIWNTLNNDLATFFVSADVTKVNDAHAGLSAARLETKSVVGVNTPAVLTIGTIFPTGTYDRDIRGGVQCSQKPLVFEGWYKYTPQGNDRGYIACIMYKYNNITHKQDTVGAAIFQPTTNTSQFTKFSLNFDYDSYLPDETPDTMNVIITSSYKYSVTSANIGTVLYVDDLNVSLSSGYDDEIQKDVEISYVEDEIIVDLLSVDKSVVSFFSVLGDMVLRQEMVDDHFVINTSRFGLNNGVYFVRVESEKYNVSKKILIF